MPNCIVCHTPNAQRQSNADHVRYDCSRCSSFVVTGTAEVTLPGLLTDFPLRRSLMSHTLRRMQPRGTKTLKLIKSDDLPTFWRPDRLPTPQQQADYLILWLGDNQETPTSWVEALPSEIAATVGMAVSPDGNSQGGWGWLHSRLEPKALYRQGSNPPGGQVGLQLTMGGWEQYEGLKKRRVESRTAFMAMKFGQADLDRVVNECFRPAVARTGFELRLITDQQPAGIIDDQMRAAILASRFVISDLTHGSPGAYWEAGFGEGMGLPVIYTCEKAAWEESKTHFDTNHLVTIQWDAADLKKAENNLAATIRATLRAEAKQTDD
jgi:hypothetical protein